MPPPRVEAGVGLGEAIQHGPLWFGRGSSSGGISPDANSDGVADLADLAVAVWDRQGHRLINDREGAMLEFRPDAVGFVDQTIDGRVWRVYYLQSGNGNRLVAAGQVEDR